MTYETLRPLAQQGLSTREMAIAVGLSQTALRYWLKRHGIETTKKQFNRGDPAQDLLCVVCGENDPTRFYGKRQRCKTCHNTRSINRARDIKLRAVIYKGGSCQKCGYSKNLASLDFHHLDPTEKHANWNTSNHWSWERLKKEIDKCLLVCKNCHGEIHHPDSDLTLLMP